MGLVLAKVQRSWWLDWPTRRQLTLQQRFLQASFWAAIRWSNAVVGYSVSPMTKTMPDKYLESFVDDGTVC